MAHVNVHKQYRTNSGLEVEIHVVKLDFGIYPVHGAIRHGDGNWSAESWTLNGKYANLVKTGLDLVEVIPEPTYRPFTPEELPRIVGRRVRSKNCEKPLVFWLAESEDGNIGGSRYLLNPVGLLSYWEFLDFDSDGNEIVTPCGVLEGGAV
jgi:hypothetical protein